jgi:hypothetical protein
MPLLLWLLAYFLLILILVVLLDACALLGPLGLDVIMSNCKTIAYYSSSLCPCNVTLSTYEKEAMAIIEAMKRWRHYFLGHKLVIRTYQENLKFMTE